MGMKGVDFFIWLRTGKDSGLHNLQGIFWPGELLLTSQEERYTLELHTDRI
jgi:hypothetical protein